jgi:hypothetical protein
MILEVNKINLNYFEIPFVYLSKGGKSSIQLFKNATCMKSVGFTNH